MPASILPSELQQHLKQESARALLDVRERGEYNSRHIPTACSFPRREIEFRASSLIPALSTPLIVYDDTGDRANFAASTFASLGYEKVCVLEGGLEAWVSSGFPTESGVNVPSKAFGEWVHEECSVPEITPEELRSRKERGDRIPILDTRTPEEFGRFCIPGGQNVPGGDLVLIANDLARERNTTVVVNCAGRTRSIIGTQTLRRLGLTNVFALQNGTMGWVLAGYDLECEPESRSLMASVQSRQQARLLSEKLAQEEGIDLMSAEELDALIKEVPQRDQALYLIDVRSQEEYVSRHIPHFQWIPGGQAVQRADDYIAVSTGTIVFACDCGPRSIMAAYWYKKMGYRNVWALRGGVDAWVESRRELEKGISSKPNKVYEDARAVVQPVSSRDLSQELKSSPNLLILDFSTSLELTDGHLPGARWLSRGWIELKFPSWFPDLGQSIVATCRTGEQSTLAARTLGEMGYRRVRVLAGGVQGWKEQGGKIEKGGSGYLMEPNDVVLSASVSGNKGLMIQYLDWEKDLAKNYHKSFLSFH